MGDLIGGLIVVLVTALVVGGIFMLVRSKQKKAQQEVIDLAARKGWRYEKVSERLISGYRLHGPRWTLEALRTSSESPSSDTGSSNVRDYTVWFCGDVVFSPGLLMIGPRQPEVNLGGISEVIRQTMLKLMIGAEADDARGIEESFIGTISLRERYMIWTNQEENARQLLAPQVEKALVTYPGKLPPVVKVSSRGLEVKLLSQRLSKPTEIEALVAIGEAFL